MSARDLKENGASKTEKSLQLGRDRHITAVFTPKEKNYTLKFHIVAWF